MSNRIETVEYIQELSRKGHINRKKIESLVHKWLDDLLKEDSFDNIQQGKTRFTELEVVLAAITLVKQLFSMAGEDVEASMLDLFERYVKTIKPSSDTEVN